MFLVSNEKIGLCLYLSLWFNFQTAPENHTENGQTMLFKPSSNLTALVHYNTGQVRYSYPLSIEITPVWVIILHPKSVYKPKVVNKWYI